VVGLVESNVGLLFYFTLFLETKKSPLNGNFFGLI